MSDQLRARFEAFYQRRHGFTPMFEDGDYWGGETVKTAWAAFRDASQAPSEGDAALLAEAVIAGAELRGLSDRYANGNPKVPWVMVREALGRWVDAHDAAFKRACAIAAEAGGKEQDHG